MTLSVNLLAALGKMARFGIHTQKQYASTLPASPSSHAPGAGWHD